MIWNLAISWIELPFPQCASAQFMSEGQFMGFSLIAPFRHKCASRPWCYALRLPTANRRGAICGIRPDKRAYRCECSWLSRRRQFIASLLARIQHILDKNAVALGGVGDHNVCDSTSKLAVLDDTPFRRKCALRPWHFVLCSISIEPPRSDLRHSPW